MCTKISKEKPENHSLKFSLCQIDNFIDNSLFWFNLDWSKKYGVLIMCIFNTDEAINSRCYKRDGLLMFPFHNFRDEYSIIFSQGSWKDDKIKRRETRNRWNEDGLSWILHFSWKGIEVYVGLKLKKYWNATDEARLKDEEEKS